MKSEVPLLPNQSQSTCIPGPHISRIQQSWKMCREGQQDDPRSLRMGPVKDQGSLAQQRDRQGHRAEVCTAGGGGRGCNNKDNTRRRLSTEQPSLPGAAADATWFRNKTGQIHRKKSMNTY